MATVCRAQTLTNQRRRNMNQTTAYITATKAMALQQRAFFKGAKAPLTRKAAYAAWPAGPAPATAQHGGDDVEEECVHAEDDQQGAGPAPSLRAPAAQAARRAASEGGEDDQGPSPQRQTKAGVQSDLLIGMRPHRARRPAQWKPRPASVQRIARSARQSARIAPASTPSSWLATGTVESRPLRVPGAGLGPEVVGPNGARSSQAPSSCPGCRLAWRNRAFRHPALARAQYSAA